MIVFDLFDVVTLLAAAFQVFFGVSVLAVFVGCLSKKSVVTPQKPVNQAPPKEVELDDIATIDGENYDTTHFTHTNTSFMQSQPQNMQPGLLESQSNGASNKKTEDNETKRIDKPNRSSKRRTPKATESQFIHLPGPYNPQVSRYVQPSNKE